MSLKTNPLRDAITFALAVGATSLAGTGLALAQTTPATGATDLDRIEVIGSRIKRAEGETAVPVLILQRADIEKTGLTQVADVLKQISVAGPALTLNTNNGNTSGNSTVNLRNCGSDRTLVLVNGRRWVSSNGLGGAVDLNSIPLAAVDRVEVLKDGGSALYGSDALCGVINIQTRRNFEGAVAKAYVGQYDDGDGFRQAYDVTVGGSGDRWSALLSVGYTKQEPVFAGNREISAVPLFGFPANTAFPGRASGIGPNGSFNVPSRGGVQTLIPGRTGCVTGVRCSPTTATDFKTFDFLTDGFNFAPDNYLIQPQTTRSLFAQAGYDIADNFRFRNEVFYTNRLGEAQLAAQPLSPLTISPTNLYNPFGPQPITASNPTGEIRGGGFRPTNFPRLFGQDQDTWRYYGGFEGELEFGDREFSWDAGYNYAENKQLQIKEGFYFTSRVNDALGASFVDANGKPRCGTGPTTIIAGCVPLNVFGGSAGLTQEMFDYISVTPRNFFKSTQESYTANLSGELFEMPAGPLAFAAGYEHRREGGSSSPDPLTAAGLVLGDNPFLPTRGSFSVDEFYGELAIPLLRDVLFAKSLEVSLAARYSDYSSFGETTNPKFTLRWQPIEDLLVRGSWGKGFRAPSISDLFAGVGQGRPSAVDPCSNNSLDYTSSATVRANCAAAGVPTTYRQSSIQVRQSTGGFDQLQPELARNRTLGLVYSPSFAPGLDMYVDWYNIEISNAIGGRSARSVLVDCYAGGEAQRCAEITRDLTGATFGNRGEIADIRSINENFKGGLETEGYDFGFGYRRDTRFGRFDTRMDNTYVSYYGDLDEPERGEINRDGEPSAGNTIGRVPANSSQGSVRWRLRSNLSTTWSQKAWSLTANVEYMSKAQETCGNVVNTANGLNARVPTGGFLALKDLCSDPNRIIDTYQFKTGTKDVIAVQTNSPVNEFDPTWYFDLQGSVTAPWNGKVTLGVRNLFDRDPPFSSDAFANSFDSQYRTPGRFIYMSYEQKF